MALVKPQPEGRSHRHKTNHLNAGAIKEIPATNHISTGEMTKVVTSIYPVMGL